MSRKNTVLLFLVVFSINHCLSQEEDNGIGGYPGAYLRMGAGARPLSMGGAFTGVANDVNATYWNPAGLAQLDGFQASTMYSIMSFNRQFNYVAVAFPSAGFGSFGFSWINFNIGKIMGRDVNGNITTPFSNSENSIMISYGGSINNILFFGGTGKYFLHELSSSSANGYGFDIGAMLRLFDLFSIGGSIQNIESRLKWDTPSQLVEHFPSTTRLGLCFQKWSMVLACDWMAMEKQKGTFSSGFEWTIKNMLSLRCGYALKRLSAGIGIYLPVSRNSYTEIAYGYGQDAIDIQPIHRLSLSFNIISNDKKNRLLEEIDIEKVFGNSTNKERLMLEKPNISTTPPSPTIAQTVKPSEIDVDINIPNTRIKNPNAVAVVIGISNYSDSSISQIKYASNDAEIMRRYLINSLGYDSSNVIVYKDNQATVGAFDKIFGPRGQAKKLGLLSNYIRPNNSEVFIYLSCHGAPDFNTIMTDSADVFLVPYDCDLNYLHESGYSLREFFEKLRLLKAKSTTVVIDACFSGRTKTGDPLIKDFRIAAIRHKKINFNLGTPLGVVFTSSSLNQLSLEYPEKQHGLFTYYFLKGLRGEADQECLGNNDGKITVRELAKYVQENVVIQAKRKNKNQVPQIWTTQKGVDRVLVNLNN